jgi:hypothetical protein
MTSLRHSIFAAAIAAVLPASGAIADDGARSERQRLFGEHSVIEVTIEAPLTTLQEVRSDEDYLEGTFSYQTADGEAGTLDLKLRTRGRLRLKPTTCDFPPVRLNFRKKQVKDTVFDGQDKLKLVAHCQNGKPSFEQLVLREYLAYRFFDVLTDNSFSVRLLRIHWIDTQSNFTRTKVGFVIEDDDDVADRLGLTARKTPNLTDDDLDRQQQNLVNVFQYMIGNTDFSLINGVDENDCCHNSVPMTATGGPPYYPVPYDFDLSGLVNAPYATPNPRFRLRDVRQRLYRGRCRNNDLLDGTLDLFIDKREDMLDIVTEVDMLATTTKNNVNRYMDSFYREITDPKRVESRFLNKCI